MKAIVLFCCYLLAGCQPGSTPESASKKESGGVSAPEEKSESGGTPEKVLTAFTQKYPDAKANWNIDRNGRHEAEFKLDGISYNADFEADGTWVETETSMDWKDLPDAVKAAFKNEDKKKDIIEIEMVDSREKGKFYDIEYKIGGGKQDIVITADGKVLGTDRL